MKQSTRLMNNTSTPQLLLLTLITLPYFLLGCTATTYPVTQINPETGLVQTLVFSKFFKAEDVLIKDKLKVMATMTIKKKNKLLLPKAKDSSEVFDKSEREALADLEVVFSNQSQGNIYLSVDLVEVIGEGQREVIFNKKKDITLVPFTVARVSIPDYLIDIYRQEIMVKIRIEKDGRKYFKDLTLKRLTKEAAQRK